MMEFLIKYKELIVILSGIGTFISALIAIFTLNEVKKQRLSLYQPDILIKSFTVSISKSPFLLEDEELIRYKVSDYNDYSNNANETKFEVFAKYKVDNLGLGIAKNIKCEWQFDTKKAIKLITKILPDHYYFQFDKGLNLYLLNNLEDDDFFYSSYSKIDKQNIDYIPPLNNQKHNHYHSIPDIIIYTHYLFLMFKNNLLEKQANNYHISYFEDFKFPKPILKIEYRDLNNKKYKADYKFSITSVVTQTGNVLDLKQEFAYLEFELE